MKRALIAISLGVAALGMTACADGYYGGGGIAYYEHSPVGYDGFYDDYYGPFYDGYWGDGGFYYSTGPGRPYALDRSNHFRRDSADGYHAFHGGMHVGEHGAGERHDTPR